MQTDPRPVLAVADDDAEFRAVVRRVAERLGWQVDEFGDGRALTAAVSQTLRPALILLDMVMPEHDGIETIGWLGASSLDCPVVLVTGRPPVYTTAACELAQARGIEILEMLHKPVPLAELRAALDPARLPRRRPG